MRRPAGHPNLRRNSFVDKNHLRLCSHDILEPSFTNQAPASALSAPTPDADGYEYLGCPRQACSTRVLLSLVLTGQKGMDIGRAYCVNTPKDRGVPISLMKDDRRTKWIGGDRRLIYVSDPSNTTSHGASSGPFQAPVRRKTGLGSARIQAFVARGAQRESRSRLFTELRRRRGTRISAVHHGGGRNAVIAN